MPQQPAGGHPYGVFTASAGQGGHGVGGGTPVVDGTAPSGVPALGVHTTVRTTFHTIWCGVLNMRTVNH